MLSVSGFAFLKKQNNINVTRDLVLKFTIAPEFKQIAISKKFYTFVYALGVF
ncbi:hypothetical protein E27107_190019 [Elizabethkingia anophelis]|nr:hypothetical protein E18064_270019 [Elizabethkingia anophelis]CDN77332.1 hypothetical protein E27107_190019 [Elizabethkingia anophelis]